MVIVNIIIVQYRYINTKKDNLTYINNNLIITNNLTVSPIRDSIRVNYDITLAYVIVQHCACCGLGIYTVD